MNNSNTNQAEQLNETAVMRSVIITEESVLSIGFVKHSDYTYKKFMNNVCGYLDEVEVFFEPNEEISIIFRQQPFNNSDLDKNSIFIREMKYIDELSLFINSICSQSYV